MAADKAVPGRYLSFILGNGAYAVPVTNVEMVLDTPAITRVPNAAPHLRGVINYRGSVVPIVDPLIRFGQAEVDTQSGSSVIVLQMKFEGDDIVVGMLADGVREVFDVAENEIEDAPAIGAMVSGDFVAGVVKAGTEFIVVLDVEAAFASSGADAGTAA